MSADQKSKDKNADTRTTAQRHAAKWVLAAVWALNAALLVLVIVETHEVSVAAVEGDSHGTAAWVESIRVLFGSSEGEPADHSGDTHHDMTAATAYVASLIVLAVAFTVFRRTARGRMNGAGADPAWAARPRRAGFWVPLALWIALAVLSLGVATYTPCVPSGGSWVVLPGWVLGLFGADVEWLGPGSTCALAFAPGFELARSLGLVVTSIAAGGLVWLFARNTLDGVRARLAGDLDVVIGLDESTMPLVRVLVARDRERDRPLERVSNRPGFAGGQSPRHRERDRPGYAWWWLSGLRPGDFSRAIKRRPKVAVVDTDAAPGLVREARAAGAIVLLADPTRSTLMRRLVSRPSLRLGKRRVTLRRLYAVTPSLRLNLDVHRVAVAKLLEAKRTETLPHLEDRVPRLLVRFDDAREARQWRLDQFSHWVANACGDESSAGSPADEDLLRPRYISDCVSTDLLAAEQVADYLLSTDQGDASPEHIVIVGESALGLTLLEEIAWRQWYRREVKGTAADANRVRRVLLVGPQSAERAAEWNDLRAPWEVPAGLGGPPLGPSLFEVRSFDGTDWESAIGSVFTDTPKAAVVFVDEKDAYAAAASRLARVHARGGRPTVFVRSSGHNVSLRYRSGSALRFGTSLVRVRPGQVETGPGDMATRAAELHHAVYVQSVPDAGNGADDAVKLPPTSQNLTAQHWDRLPGFYQEDNVRQLWHVLAFFTLHGFEWVTVTHHDSPDPRLISDWDDLVKEAASSEYERWKTLRLRYGWWPATPVTDNGRERAYKHDGYRMHSELGEHATLDMGKNRDMVVQVLRRMWAMGYGLRWKGDGSETEGQSVAVAERS